MDPGAITVPPLVPHGTWVRALAVLRGRTKGAKRVVAAEVTGVPVGALVVPASTHENLTTQLMLEHLSG